MQWLLVFVFGGLGAVARVGAGALVAGRAWPWGTFAVNVVGCFLIGVAFHWFEQRGDPGPWRVALIGGFLGGFTTFSAFGLETLHLLRDGQPAAAAGYVAASLAVGIVAVAAGLALGRQLA